MLLENFVGIKISFQYGVYNVVLQLDQTHTGT
jgi:hypothetical protein